MREKQLPFDRKLSVNQGRIQRKLLDTFIFVNDTLEFAQSIGQQQFGERLTPELTLEIYREIIKVYEKIGEPDPFRLPLND